MKKLGRKILYALFFIIATVLISGLVLAYLPGSFRINNKGITPEEAASLRQTFTLPYNIFTTKD